MTPRIRSVAVVAGAATVAALLSAPPAQAASPDLVISQVYGGGGNSGATYTNDFIELYNRGTTTVDVSGWSVQYASASGFTWQVTTLSGTVAPGARYLVQEAAGAGGTVALPSPDATGSIAMSASSGKVALVESAIPLGCGASCHLDARVRDFVGYGGATDFEGASAAPGLSNTTADLRAGGGATDTDDNGADFTAGTPSPRGTSGGGSGGGATLRIHDIQGAAHRSPVTGKTVASVPGVVTATTSNGFWMQDPQPDDDPATSEAVFVFTSSAPSVTRGDAVTVSGRVSEYRPGGYASANLSTTEISGAAVTVTGHDATLPAPTLIGPGGRTVPAAVRTDTPGDVEKSTTFDVTANALDFYESMEGMLVEVDDSVAVGPTNKYGELAVLPGGAGQPRTARGGIVYSYADANPERLILSSALARVPVANVGDRLPGAVVGVLDYNFSNFMLDVLAPPTVVPGGIAPETTRVQRWNELAVATYNVENLDPGDPQAKFDRLATNLVHNLSAPDIVAVEEIQDNDGPTDDGVVAADVTWHKLIDAIRRAGGPGYDFRSVDPSNDTDGGEPGGNIRVGFLFRTDRDLTFVDRPGADATTPTQVVPHGNGADLTLSPGRIDPTNPAFDDSRKPLAGEFRFRGQPVFVVANHFNSKGGDEPLMGRYQPPVRPSEAQRHAQAQVVRSFVDQIRAVDADANVVVLGDLNDFEFSQTADILTGDGFLTDLPRTLPLSERYTYVYEGNSQVLDQILLSAPLAAFGYDYDVVHINSEFADQASDHDPQVVRLEIRPGD
ncbi:MAG TPA: lamin tail domain-containing protein [Micromonosporaceae bacterium]